MYLLVYGRNKGLFHMGPKHPSVVLKNYTLLINVRYNHDFVPIVKFFFVEELEVRFSVLESELVTGVLRNTLTLFKVSMNLL